MIGTVQSAEAIKATDHLLRLEVDLGEAGVRQLVAGLASTHDPRELIGKQIVVLGNLEEKEIRGIRSQGMLLAAEAEGTCVLLVPEKAIPPGTKVR